MSHEDSQHTSDATGAPTSEAPAVTPVPENRLPGRSMVLGFGALLLVLVGGLVLVRVLFAERIPDLTEERLQAAAGLWEQNGPVSYEMDVELRGAQPGKVQIQVKDGAVIATTRNNREPPKWTWDTWAVPGMFETLEQDLQIASDPEKEIQAAPGTKWWLRCDFDPKNGLPRLYHRQVTGNGPEVYWRVTRFEAR